MPTLLDTSDRAALVRRLRQLQPTTQPTWGTLTAADQDGNVFVTGSSSNGTNYDWATIKYSPNVSPVPLALQKVNNQLVLSWTNAVFGLQSASAITGTFTNLPGATSPYTNSITGAQQFFRLISN